MIIKGRLRFAVELVYHNCVVLYLHMLVIESFAHCCFQVVVSTVGDLRVNLTAPWVAKWTHVHVVGST